MEDVHIPSVWPVDVCDSAGTVEKWEWPRRSPAESRVVMSLQKSHDTHEGQQEPQGTRCGQNVKIIGARWGCLCEH